MTTPSANPTAPVSGVTLTLGASEQGEPTCPLCPPGEEGLLLVRWECYVYLDGRDLSPGEASSRHWKVTCAAEHVLVTAWDWYGDDEYPDPPRLDDVVAWLRWRQEPPVRDHVYKSGDPEGPACWECGRPASDHEEASR